MTSELQPAASERGPLVRVRVLLGYDGTAFHGFAYQNAELPTVALSLRIALSKLMGYEPELTVAGRTDAGVHAWGQVVSFDMPLPTFERFGLERITRSLRKQVGPSIVIRHVDVAPDDFSARFSAKGRSYRYTIRNADVPSPFTHHLEWHVPEHLDVDLMHDIAQYLIGEHDFTSFCRQPTPPASLTRRVFSAEWLRVDDDVIRFDVSANAFCHQQVRSMVGMLVAIGRKQRKPEQLAEALGAKDRSAAMPPAPPQGLCLWSVQY